MDKSIAELNAQFHTGASDEKYCDCLGLILLHMRINHYAPIDQEDIPRGLTRHHLIRNWLKKFGCVEVKGAFYSDEPWLIALMWYSNDDGHLGVYFPEDNVIHHMSPFGKMECLPTENTTFWKYTKE